jgi:soluble lytic murein transglycosylase
MAESPLHLISKGEEAVRRRRPIGTLVIGSIMLSVLLVFGVRWFITQYYPLRYREAIFAYAQENRLDPYLVAAVIRTESKFRPGATSPQGARGLMQLMPETAAEIAQQMKLPYDPQLLHIPEYNIRLGCFYLAQLRDQFDGNTVLALAAYNGGQSNVKRWLRENRWTGEFATIQQIPFDETRLYVAHVLRDFTRYQRIYGPSPSQKGAAR